MKKLFWQKIVIILGISYLIIPLRLQASILPVHEDSIKSSKASITCFPQRLTVEEFEFIRINSSALPLKYVSLESYPNLKFSYGGDISAIALLETLPMAHLELSPPPVDSNNVILFKENGQLNFKLFFDIFLKEDGRIISGYEKYKRHYYLMIRGIVSNPDTFI